jgi:hypothetical protein
MKVSGDGGGKARANRPGERWCDAVAAISHDDGAKWIVLLARLSILRWRGFGHISSTR